MGKKNKDKKKVHIKAKSPIVNQKSRWIILGILAITFVAFSPSLKNEFVNWDDDRNLYENETVLNLNVENIKELFTSTVIGNYNPLSNLVLGIQHKMLEGSDSYYMGFHLTNILLHLFCVWMVYLIGRNLGLRRNAQIILTLLFALHPLRVESVTWVTEIKDVLYGAFFLAGLYDYTQKKTKSSNGFSIGIFLLFFIGLFAKIQMVVFPLALVCIDYWRGQKNLVKSAIKHWPYFLTSLTFGLIGIMALKGDGSLETNATFNLFQRLFIGSYSWCVYLIKSIVPYRMSPLYPYPPVLSIWHYISMVPFLASLGALFYFWKSDKKVLFFGGMFFTANIILLLQILGAGQGYLADRFTYIAYFGLFFIYAYYLEKWMQLPKFKTWLPYIIGLALLGFSALTFQQTKIWKNSATLWTHVLKYYQNSTLPWGNRANYYRDNGMKEKAMSDYSATINLKPNNAAPYNSRAKLYFSMNQDAKALEDYKRAVALEPDNSEYRINKGAAHAKLKQWELSLQDLNKGLEISPDNANGLLNRSLVWQELRRWDKTQEDLLAYLKLKPNDANIWHESGRVYRILGNENQALISYNKAISLNSQNGIFYVERAKLHYKLGNMPMAKSDVAMAKRLGAKVDPAFEGALGG